MANDQITGERTDWKGLHAAGSAAALLPASTYLIGGIVAGPPIVQGLIPASVGKWFDFFLGSAGRPFLPVPERCSA